MIRKIYLGVFFGAVVIGACGCGSPEAGSSSPAEKKTFAGGEMPADAKAKFQQGNPLASQSLQDNIAKAKANAMAGKN